MIDHTGVSVSVYPVSKAFYLAALATGHIRLEPIRSGMDKV